MVRDKNGGPGGRELGGGGNFRTISILSGKGGVGKSNIAAALSLALADFGKRVTLVDADLGMANLDIICGVTKAKYTIKDILDGSRRLEDVLVHFRVSRRAMEMNGSAALLPGGFGIKEIADLREYELERLFTTLSELEDMTDYLIMDAGAGIHKGVLSFAYASEITLLVTTPEPTSIRDAYGVVKSLGAAAFFRPQLQSGISPSLSLTPFNSLMLVVNLAGSSQEAYDVAERIRRISMQYLGNAPIYLGYVLKDPEVERSVRACRVFYGSAPDSQASVCVRNLAGELLRMIEGRKIDKEKIPGQQEKKEGFIRRLIRAMTDKK